MTLAFILAAIRRHPFSIAFTAPLLAAFASLLGASVPLALGGWAATVLVGCELWYAIEPLALRRLAGCRAPTHAERELLDQAITIAHLQPLIVETPGLVIGRAVRTLVVGRDLLEVADERALVGLLHQTCATVHRANIGGVLVVWSGNLPILGAYQVSRALAYLGQLLGVLVGESLLVPLVAWRYGFVSWSGRVFGSVLVGLLGSMLLSSGFAAAGAALLIAWAVVPGLQAVLDWEARRLEHAADRASVAAGFGAQLLEALELLLLTEPRETPLGLLGLVCRPGAPLATRADRIRNALSKVP